MRRLFAAVIAGAWMASASAGEVEKIDLFEAGRDGYVMYRIPGVVVTAKGSVLAYCEARKSGGDWSDIDVFLRRSEDGGKTWSPQTQIVHNEASVPPNPVAPKSHAEQGVRTVNNPVAIVDRSGAVHFLYCVEYGRCFYMKSDDDGRTFSTPVDVTATFDAFRPEYDWKVLATGPGHGIQLANGRLVVAVWLSTSTGANQHHPSVAATIYSDDGGKTWRRGDIAAPDTPETDDPNETVVVQLADGRVMLNVRNEGPSLRRLVTISPDGATGWTKPEFVKELAEPICMGSIVRLPASAGVGPDRLIFAQPHKTPIPAGSPMPKEWKDRKNLSIKVSRDSGATWPLVKTLEPGPSAYSDLAVLPDGTILCLYERSREVGPDAKGKPYDRLTLARIPASWLPE
ncbi:sialidase family protein [Paludisphaera rhizosphaerae]|uniref:sialidase family protein n=1 Tax=Paludisphaera rhizosphaerae TaxID=2711216 RepID=UPI0013EDE4AB|nr:sialidase family protein [Paludisphaera rhizosphaerae]